MKIARGIIEQKSIHVLLRKKTKRNTNITCIKCFEVTGNQWHVANIKEYLYNVF